MSLAPYAEGKQIASSIQSGAGSAFNGISSVQNYINGVTGSTNGAGQYVLIPPKGFLGGIGGFVFDYEDEDELELTSDITDHFAEDNSSVQDHIALLPYRITLRGFVSELTLVAPGQGLFGTLTTITQKLGTVDAYLGKYTPQAVQKLGSQISGAVSKVQNYANEAAQYLNQAKNIAALFGGNSAAPTKQQKSFITLASLRDQRQLFSILTPWVFRDNMAIESLTFIQPKETKSKSDIAVTMKQMRFVDIQSTQTAQAKFAGRAAFSYQSQTNLGSTPGTSLSLSSPMQVAPSAAF